jgi:homoserine kinase type II
VVGVAAFTKFSDTALENYLVMFGIGELVSCTAIESGIENSNYFITTSKHGEDNEFVLTIMEELSFNDLPFFNNLLRHLFHFGLPVPAPQQTLDGMTSTIFCGKPTVVYSRLAGKHLTVAGEKHCFEIGKTLAEIHSASATKNLQRENPFDIDWMSQTIKQVDHLLSDVNSNMLVKLADEYAEVCELDLPKGIIHGDLFRDNVLFENDQLTGVIDFYHACNDYLIQDVAITINDWCKTQSGIIDQKLQDSLLQGYESIRVLEDEEREFLPCFQRAGSARFALTRLLSGDGGGHLKDPGEFLELAARLS